jgi:acetyltransferase-like isoleucine patch superfamily enzyme
MTEDFKDGIIIYENVSIGENPDISPFVVLGKKPLDRNGSNLKLVIGKNAVIRSFTTIYLGSKIGDFLSTGQNVSIREDNEIGDNVSIGTCSVVEFGNSIGDGTRIHSGCFLEMAKIGINVFIGPNTVLIDDPHPMNCPHYKQCRGGVIIEDLAKIGANSTILAGVRIGKNSLVGAGSVVVDDVPPDEVHAGNPARFIKKIGDLKCEKGFFERPYLWEPYI